MADKIGIGICTYNRADLLKHTLGELLKFSDNTSRIIVANDGSTDHTLDVIKDYFGIEYLSGSNEGQIRNKNRLLRILSDCDHIFIIEDDFLFFRSGWEELVIHAQEVSGIRHFTFSPPGRYGKCLHTSEFDDLLIQHAEMDGGAFAYYTKEVIEKCGGYCGEFKGYGWGHCEFSERIHRAGLAGKYKNNHIKETLKYMALAKADPVIPIVERKEAQLRNHEIWNRSIAEGWTNCPL